MLKRRVVGLIDVTPEQPPSGRCQVWGLSARGIAPVTACASADDAEHRSVSNSVAMNAERRWVMVVSQGSE